MSNAPTVKKDLRSSRRGGFYWGPEGKPYVSVTHAIDILSKPGLMYWHSKQVYYAMAKDPSLKEEEAMAAPRQVSQSAADRGTTVHSLCESFKNTGKLPEFIPSGYEGYAKAFAKWIKEFDIKIVENERSLFSKLHQFAGTVDFIYRIGDNPEIIVGDIKTGKDLYDTVWLQTSAYMHALKENGIDAQGVSALLLKEDGTYRFERGEDQFQYFLFAKYLWEWKNKDTCRAVGYESVVKQS